MAKNSISARMTVNVLDKAVSGLKIKDDEYLTIVREKSETMSPIFEAVYSDGTTADIKTENAKFERRKTRAYSALTKPVQLPDISSDVQP